MATCPQCKSFFEFNKKNPTKVYCTAKCANLAKHLRVRNGTQGARKGGEKIVDGPCPRCVMDWKGPKSAGICRKCLAIQQANDLAETTHAGEAAALDMIYGPVGPNGIRTGGLAEAARMAVEPNRQPQGYRRIAADVTEVALGGKRGRVG
jgi:hypothetical protein